MSTSTIQDTTHRVLDALITADSPFSWEQLMEGVKAAGADVTNWMEVRGVLQQYRNEGLIKRSKDLTVEEYAAA